MYHRRPSQVTWQLGTDYEPFVILPPPSPRLALEPGLPFQPIDPILAYHKGLEAPHPYQSAVIWPIIKHTTLTPTFTV